MTDQGRPRYELPPSIPKDETKDPDAAVGHQGAAADSASRVREKVLAKTNGKAAGGVRRTDEEDTLRTRRSFSSGDFSGIGSRGSGGGGWKSWGGSYRSLTDDSSEDSAHSSPPSPDSFSPAAWLSPRPAGSGKGIVEDGGHPGPFWGGGARPSRIESEDSLGTKRRPRRRAGKGMVLGSGDGELHSVAEAEATKGIKVTGAGGDVSNEACDSPSSHGSNSVDSGPLMKFLSTVSGGGTWASDVSGKSGVSRTNAAVYRERKGAGEPDPPLLVPAIRKKKVTCNHAVLFWGGGGGREGVMRDNEKSKENDRFFSNIRINLLYLTEIYVYLCMCFRRKCTRKRGFIVFLFLLQHPVCGSCINLSINLPYVQRRVFVYSSHRGSTWVGRKKTSNVYYILHTNAIFSRIGFELYFIEHVDCGVIH